MAYVPDYFQHPFLLRTDSDQGPADSPSPSASSWSRSSPPAPSSPPKKGDADYVKRPENAFILFRRKCCEDRLAMLRNGKSSDDEDEDELESAEGSKKKGSKVSRRAKTRGKRERQAELSKTISSQWRALSAEERTFWENLAKEKKREHEEMYPDYVYRPQKKEWKQRRKAKGKERETSREGSGRRAESEHGKRFTEGSPVDISRPSKHYQRASSVPAPYPPLFRYTVVQVPRVAHGMPQPQQQQPPYSPPTPFLPMPAQGGLAQSTDFASDYAPGFDYLPPTDYVPPSRLSQDGADAIQTSEFLQSMFDMSGLSSAELDSFQALASSPSQSQSHLQTESQDSLMLPAMTASPSVASPESSTGPASPYPAQQLSPAFIHEGSQLRYSSQPQADVDFSQYIWDEDVLSYPEPQPSPYWSGVSEAAPSPLPSTDASQAIPSSMICSQDSATEAKHCRPCLDDMATGIGMGMLGVPGGGSGF